MRAQLAGSDNASQARGQRTVRAWHAILHGMEKEDSTAAPLPGDGADIDRSTTPRQFGWNDLDCWLYIDGVRHVDGLSVAEAISVARTHERAFVLVGLSSPTDVVIAEIADAFGVAQYTVLSALGGGQHPRLDRSDDIAFLEVIEARYGDRARRFDEPKVIDLGQLMLIVGPVLAVVHHKYVSPRLWPRAALAAETSPAILSYGPWAMVHSLLTEVVDGFSRALAEIRDDINFLESLDHDRYGSRYVLNRLRPIKLAMAELKKAVLPLDAPLRVLVDSRKPVPPPPLEVHYRGLRDELLRVTQQLYLVDDQLNFLLDHAQAATDVDQNRDMRKIASWAGIAAVWGIVTGLYQMTNDFSILHGENAIYTFWASIALASLASVVLYLGFRRKGWL